MDRFAAAAARKLVVNYLTQLRAAIVPAARTRAAWASETSAVFRMAGERSPAAVAMAAKTVGEAQAAAFLDARDRLKTLLPPPPCAACASAARVWIERELIAQRVFLKVGASGDVAHLEQARPLLRAAHEAAARFEDEFQKAGASMAAVPATVDESASGAHLAAAS
jgi:hypothetical protein